MRLSFSSTAYRSALPRPAAALVSRIAGMSRGLGLAVFGFAVTGFDTPACSVAGWPFRGRCAVVWFSSRTPPHSIVAAIGIRATAFQRVKDIDLVPFSISTRTELETIE